MKKKTVTLLSLSILLLFSASASAIPFGFSGIFEPGNWTFTNTNADGSYTTGLLDPSGAADSISITGGNTWSYSEGSTDFTIDSPYSETVSVSFDWSYETADADGPKYDPFGFIVGNDFESVFTRLTQNYGPDSQSGSTYFDVQPGQFFGFRVKTLDNLYGAATAKISNFDVTTSHVAEPGTMILLGSGFFGVAGIMRRNRKKREK
jgi:hypothetical protein